MEINGSVDWDGWPVSDNASIAVAIDNHTSSCLNQAFHLIYIQLVSDNPNVLILRTISSCYTQYVHHLSNIFLKDWVHHSIYLQINPLLPGSKSN